MTEYELEKKAKEYANTTEFTEYANSSLSESLDISEEIKQAYIAGAKKNGVIWHDLRKNPNDLPNPNTNVLVKTDSITECAVFHRRLDGTCFWSCSFEPIERHPKSVIAWCELPKFEVEE